MFLPFPENLEPASKSLREDVLLAAIQFTTERTVVLEPQSTPDSPIIRERYMKLGADPPHFITSRLPATPTKRHILPRPEYDLYVKNTQPASLSGANIFVGRISIIRHINLPLSNIRHTWSVHYEVNSPRRRFIRTVMGEVVELNPSTFEETILSELPEQEEVRAAFPKLFAVTEAWQLKKLLQQPNGGDIPRLSFDFL